MAGAPATSLAAADNLTALAASSAVQAPAAPGTAAATDATAVIEAPVTSTAFAAEAGYRIAVMVREGVTSAQLQLNPAEMGPVTVQIVVDGQSAQVHLAAAQADTRQALEASMPQLASSLREAGLTLTGGGVFEQAQQQPGAQQNAGSGNARGGRQGPGDETPRTARGGSGWQPRGMVDLVA